jgi:hypothetical protein
VLRSRTATGAINTKHHLIAFFFSLVFVLLLHLRLFQYAEDDAYIHLRVVENLLRHGKPYFNLSEPVMVSSSPGWTLFLTLFFNVRPLSPIEVAVVNALFTTSGAFIFMYLLRFLTNSSRRDGYYWLFGVIYVSVILTASLGLMEIPISLLILGLAILLFAKGNRYGFSLMGAAVFFRLEIIIFLVIFHVYNLLKRKISGKSALRYTAMGMLPFVIYELFFFNTIIPNTLAAKSIIYLRSYFDIFIGVIFGLVPELPFFSLSIYQILIRIIFLVLIGFSIAVLVADSVKNRIEIEAYQISLATIISGALIAAAYLKQRVYLFPWYIPLYSVPYSFLSFI